jgi:hypothetical protein
MKTIKTLVNIYLVQANKELDYPFIAKNMEFGSKNGLHLVTGNSNNSLDLQPQHFYFTIPQSDLEISRINIGDYCLKWSGGKWIVVFMDEFQYKLYNELWNEVKYEKIIATTDTSLKIHTIEQFGLGASCDKYTDIPSIPQSFIEHFISEYNKGRIVKQVEIELEKPKYINSNFTKPYADGIVKLNQQNEISIVTPKQVYSKEEVDLLIKRAITAYDVTVSNEIEWNTDNWIKDNI